ncbi:MAG: response regulator transcription factor [Phycisphaerae bacterium]|jgi:two-component system response regulator CpxR
MSVNRKLLLIDDDAELAELLHEFLSPQGFELHAVQTGRDGVRGALSGEPAAIVLDVMLPDIDGFEVLRQIRAQSATPVIMLTARGDDVDRIVGLELGADDYLPKPFNPRELVARIGAILRRAQPPDRDAQTRPAQPRVRVGDVDLDPGSREVFKDGQRVALTGVEFDLLETLMRSCGKTVSRSELFRKVLDRDPDPFDRSIDMHVSHLRRKLGHACGGVERIKSVRGVGYVYTRVEPG